MKLLKLLFLVCFSLALNAVVLSQTATVTVKKANLREKPTMKSKVLDTLANQTSLEVIRQKGAWFFVQSPDKSGWIHGSTITLIGDNSTSGQSTDQSSSKEIGSKKSASPKKSSAERTYIRGPRGGCYYINSSGNKSYVSRSLCN